MAIYERIKGMKTKKAVAGTTAKHIKRHNKPYPKTEARSRANLKQEVGELAFYLQFPIGQDLGHFGWELLERRLREYINLTHSGRTL